MSKWKNKWVTVFRAAGFCAVFANAYAADITLVKDGIPQATIMTAAKPTKSAQIAVKEFNHYMKKITGTELPVITDDKDEKGSLVLIGESCYANAMGFKNTDFEKQEYLIKITPGRLVLMGFDGQEFGTIDYEGNGLWKEWGTDGWFTNPVGTCYATHDFLRKLCGLRWYLPTDLGEVVPGNKTLSFEKMEIRRKPYLEYRDHSCWAFDMPAKLYMLPDETVDKAEKLPLREKNLFYLRHKEGGRGFVANHSFGGWENRFSKTHPKYGALQPDGLRNFRQLCYLSEAVQDQIMKDIEERIAGEKANPSVNMYDRNKYIVIMPGDYKDWCCCPECSRHFDPANKDDFKKHFSNGYASNYVWPFINRMAEKVKKIAPDKQVTCAAYWDYYLPPAMPGFKLQDNVAVMLCRTGLTQYGPLFAEDGYRKEDMLKWKELAKDLYAWEYVLFPLYGKDNLFPAIVPRRVAEAMKFHKELGTKGIFYQHCANNFWRYPAMEHLHNYMAMTLNDDIDQDPNAILNEYYKLFFGPAAKPMKAFNEEMEKMFVDGGGLFKKSIAGGANETAIDAQFCWTKLCPPGKIKELSALMEKAKLLAKDEPYKSRIALMDNSILQFMKIHSERTFRVSNLKIRGTSPFLKTAAGSVPGPSNPLWAKTIPIEDFFDASAGLDNDTKVMIFNDDANLYVYLNCLQAEPVKSEKRPRDDLNICGDDSVEIFIDPKDGQGYKQFIVNASGSLLDDRELDFSWNGAAEIQTGTNDKGWYAILKIPLRNISTKISSAPEPGTSWGMNFCRNRISRINTGKQYTSWALMSGNFHQPEKFGQVIFTRLS